MSFTLNATSNCIGSTGRKWWYCWKSQLPLYDN